MKQIYVVEDHPIFRRGIVDLIDEQIDLCVCGECDNASQAFWEIRDGVPHAVVTDLTVNGMSGLELIKAVRGAGLDMPILVFSVHPPSLYAERVLRAGANGYLSKDHDADALLAALRGVLAGQIHLPGSESQRLLRRLVGSGAAPGRDAGPLEVLTDRQLEVFRLIGQGLGTRAIGDALHISIKTVESHRAAIIERLALSGGTELVRRAVEFVVGGDLA